MDFRPKYRELTEAEKTRINRIKDAAQELGDLLEAPQQTRELSLAKTKLEECVMWAVKGITG